ncbi:MAG: DegT/DnrJ/EryC1/StrS family aminotransferase [Deltaproteobacteria bacterium]|nr:DegT/DnrJ/EryC1/StrS family aminotransferase [Deltaproteobacteria bacterium]
MSPTNINVFRPYYRIDECLKNIGECLENGWTAVGNKTIEFEDKWRSYSGHRYAHFLNSCTAALHLAIKALAIKHSWGAETEILSTPITFTSTNHAILYNGFKPIFVDVDQYGCLDPEDLKRKINKNCKAIVFVSFGGSSGQFRQVKALAKEYGLKLILDNAHAAGSRLDNETFGLNEDVVCYSFHATKNLPIGTGGMFCTHDEELNILVKKLAWLGIDKDTWSRSSSPQNTYAWEYNIEHIGYNYAGNALMAAIGLVGLKYLDEDNAYRRQLVETYRRRLADNFTFVPVPDNCLSSRHLVCLLVKKRERLIEALQARGVNPGVHYKSCLEFGVFKDFITPCPNAEIMSNEVMTLPLHLQLKEQDINYISDILLDII